MTDRSQLGWRIPRDERESFVAFVEEKWGEAGAYLRFEMENAMREYLDRDADLAQAESLLREYLASQGLSSSTQAIGTDVDHSETVKLGHRVNAELKEEFAAFAKEHSNDSLGAVLTRALRAYRDGGRGKRLLEAVQQLITGGSTDDADESPALSSGTERGTTGEAVESQADAAGPARADGGSTDGADESVDVDPQAVMEVGDGLPDTFPKQEIDSRIAHAVGGDAQVIGSYREAILDYVNAVEHPHKDGVYIPEAVREGQTFWCDLNRELRAARLRRLLVYEALEEGTRRHGVTYRDVQEMFKEALGAGPSHDYAYTLMDDAADLDGFYYGDFHGTRKLRVDVHEAKDEIVGDVVADDPTLDPDELAVDGLITSYTAGPAPQQEGCADD